MPFDIVDAFAVSQSQQKEIEDMKKEIEDMKKTIQYLAEELEKQGLITLKRSDEKEAIKDRVAEIKI